MLCFKVMEKNQPHGPSTPSSPYDFIVNPASPAKKSGFFSSQNNSFIKRALIILGVAVLLIILIIGLSRIFLGDRSANAKRLVDLAAEQQEIIRLTGLTNKNTSNPSLLALAQTTKSTVSYQQSSLLAYLKSKNVKYKPDQLDAKKDSELDKSLTRASDNNQFDKVFEEKLRLSLTNYQTSLKTSYKTASNSTSRKLLSDSYDSINLILKN